MGWPILATLWNIFGKKCVFICKMRTKVIILAKLLIMMVGYDGWCTDNATHNAHWSFEQNAH